jgi:geranylgeranyl diphosphate synthase, type I
VSALPSDLAEYAAEIDAALDTALDRLLPRLDGYHPALAVLGPQMRGFVAGGKRIRPALLLLGFQAAGGAYRQAVHGPALALEMLHTCALMHDDVIDRAPTRRGRPTVHHAFAERHAAAGWRGDPAGYGEAVAILLGDLAFVQADELFLSAEVPDRTLLDAFRRFTVLREEVMAGQYLDLQASVADDGDRELALAIATLKSGRYSVTRPLEIGAALAGADAELIDGLRAVGDPLGQAFQVRDDLLGVFGTSARTGKSTDSDLAEGKRTLLIAEALQRLDSAGRVELTAGLGDPDLDGSTADRLRELLETSGARRAAERFVDDSIATARTAIDALAVPDGTRAVMRAVADYLGAREA